MCKEELNQIDEMEDEVNQEQEYFTQDEVYDIIEQVTPKIEVNTEDVQNYCIDEQEYIAGVQSMSFLVGQYSALRSAGIDSSSAIDIIVNERNIEFNLQINEMTCTSNERTAKIQQINQEQNQV